MAAEAAAAQAAMANAIKASGAIVEMDADDFQRILWKVEEPPAPTECDTPKKDEKKEPSSGPRSWDGSGNESLGAMSRPDCDRTEQTMQPHHRPEPHGHV